MSFRSTVLASCAAAVSLVLAGCVSTPATTADSPLTGAKVTGTEPKTPPALTLPKTPFSVTDTVKMVVTEGTGDAVAKDDLIQVNAVIYNGKDGKKSDSTYENGPVSLDLSNAGLFPSLKNSIPGAKVGSRLLVASPPKDAFGTAGNSSLGISGTDTVVFVIDVVNIIKVLKEAGGTAVPPKAGLPTVKAETGKEAVITMPKTAAPTTLVVQPLIQGGGAVVHKGQTIRVTYTGAVWATGKVFDSSAKHPETPSAEFPIGVGKVVPGWDKGLVGQKVGSRLLLVLPPAEGYGTAGQPSAGIKGTDTLVFVVDVLAAY